MMKQTTGTSNIIATGFAMFSMFFGAGNVVFPLALGQQTQSMTLFAILGLLITGVGVPFLGLFAMTLFNGCYQSFFGRMGKVIGFAVTLIIIGLIGPFGAIPRCITLSYSTIKLFIPGISLPIFSAIACLVILALTYHRKNLIDILGYLLTPILLGSLALIIILGLSNSPEIMTSNLTAANAFAKGFLEGYQTMDLLGAFFFSSVVILCLKKALPDNQASNTKQLVGMTLKASVIGAVLLAMVYIGFSFVAAFHSEALLGVPKDELISRIAVHVMGPYAGLVVCIAVAVACLTTAIALSAVVAEYLHETIPREKLSYQMCLILTLILTFFISTFEFSGIANLLVPILSVCYPALIALSGFNILYQLYQFQAVKIPVFSVFAISLAAYAFL